MLSLVSNAGGIVMSKGTGLRHLGIGAIAVMATAVASPASASIAFTAVVGDSPVAGVSYVNFDNLVPPAGGTSGGVGVAFAGNAQSATGASSGVFAAPVISNGNGANFGNPDGVDTTPYITSGTSSWTLTLPGQFNYFGLLWGSVDTYNTLQFFNGATLVGTILGSTIPPANGDQGTAGTVYLNAFSTLLFDTIVGSSTQFAFEADNAAFGNVPEPGTLTLFGIGLIGLGLVRRRRAATRA
jgi:hypothetical protein